MRWGSTASSNPACRSSRSRSRRPGWRSGCARRWTREASRHESPSRCVINVLLADDHPVFREGVRRILERETDIKVVAETDTGAKVVALLVEFKPDILLLDISMAGPGHLAILRD